MPRILYLSCHEILEYDELMLFHELGYPVFSPGSYLVPQREGEGFLRPGIPGLTYDPNVVEQYNRIGAAHPGQDGKNFLTKDFVDNFDVVVVMHVPEWIERNWEAMKHKRVIWRTIGQSVASTEARLAQYKAHGLQIVRYSPQEAYIPHFAGQDALIRFYKDPTVYGNWVGARPQVITFAQSMQQRGSHCNYALFESVTRPFPRKLFGPGNNQPGFGMGPISWTQQVQELRQARVYFYTGTQPASYTLNFIEAWMSGIPVVAIGPQYGNAEVWRNHNLYEVHNLIKHGQTGFVSDSPSVLRNCVGVLLKDRSLATRVGEAGRAEAIRHFDKSMIRSAWESFLGR